MSPYIYSRCLINFPPQIGSAKPLWHLFLLLLRPAGCCKTTLSWPLTLIGNFTFLSLMFSSRVPLIWMVFQQIAVTAMWHVFDTFMRWHHLQTQILECNMGSGLYNLQTGVAESKALNVLYAECSLLEQWDCWVMTCFSFWSSLFLASQAGILLKYLWKSTGQKYKRRGEVKTLFQGHWKCTLKMWGLKYQDVHQKQLIAVCQKCY